MVEKLFVNGRDVVQMPLEDYNALMEFVQSEKKKKDEIYRERIAMAERYVAEGKTISVDEMFAYCRGVAQARSLKDVVNG